MDSRHSTKQVPRVRVPSPAWFIATLVALVVSVVGSVVLTHAVDRGNQERFDITMDVFKSVIADQVDGYRIVSFGLPALLGASADDSGVDFVGDFVGDRTTAVTLASALPVDGFAGIGLLDFSDGENVSPGPLMLPSLQNLEESTLLIPEVVGIASEAFTSRRNVISDPLDLSGGVVYAYAIPTVGDVVVVEFLDPDVLISTAGIRNGVRAVEAQARDAETGRVVGSTDSVPVDDEPNTTVPMSLLGRDLLIDVYPGVGFDWEPGWRPGVSTFAMGFLIAVLIYIVGVVNRRRSLEQAERLALARQVNEDKDRFIAAVSHELRTPLTSVVGLADELNASLSTFGVDQIHELIGIMAQESHEMSLLVEDLLVAARLEEGVIEPLPESVSVDAQVEQVTKGLSDSAAAVAIEPGGAVAFADPLRLRQILRNLITNALRHGGPQVRIRSGSNDTTMFIEVSDDGSPVPEEARDRMFEPYYRSAVVRGQAPSVGLGLSVSHRLAELMDGSLSYTYRNEWSVFRLELPTGGPEAASAPSPTPAAVAGD